MVESWQSALMYHFIELLALTYSKEHLYILGF